MNSTLHSWGEGASLKSILFYQPPCVFGSTSQVDRDVGNTVRSNMPAGLKATLHAWSRRHVDGLLVAPNQIVPKLLSSQVTRLHMTWSVRATMLPMSMATLTVPRLRSKTISSSHLSNDCCMCCALQRNDLAVAARIGTLPMIRRRIVPATEMCVQTPTSESSTTNARLADKRHGAWAAVEVIVSSTRHDISQPCVHNDGAL